MTENMARAGSKQSSGRGPEAGTGLDAPQPPRPPQFTSESSRHFISPQHLMHQQDAVGLRYLIECLDKKMLDRFDRIEARLDHLVVNAPTKCAGAPPPLSTEDDAEQPIEPDTPMSIPTERLRTPRSTAISSEPNNTCGMDSLTGSDILARNDTGDVETYQLRSEWLFNKLKGQHFHDAEEEHWRTLDDFDYTDSNCEEARGYQSKPWYVISPSSRFRLGWDLTMMGVIAHDMAVIPVHMAFYDNSENVVSAALFWPCLVFWTLDIFLSFFTAFYDQGALETSMLKIAKNYILSWFFLDIAMVGSSWAEIIIDVQSEPLGLGRVGKTLRILRIVRSMRLLRLVKLRRILEDIQDRITSEYVHIIMSVFRLSVVIIWTNHFIACGWWAIGASGPTEGAADSDTSWTSHFQFQSADITYQYATALHWSLTQFTPASMEVSPRNVGERVFAVLVLVFAMIVFSSFVSSITAAMTQLRQLSSTIDKSFVMLRRYLRVRRTPADLTLRIVRCVEHRLSSQKEEIPESSVQLLQFMSQPLQMELLSHVYAPLLTRHPFFRRYAEADLVAMQRLCLHAVQRLSLSTGDALFTEACSGEQMFFVRKGMLRYFPRRTGRTAEDEQPFATASSLVSSMYTNSVRELRTSPSMKRATTRHPVAEFVLEKGDFFCETSLWCPWAHTGTMIAVQMTEVLALDAAALSRVTSSRRLVIRSTHRYGKAYVESLNKQAADSTSDVSQLTPELIENLAQRAFKHRGTIQSSSNSQLIVETGGAEEVERSPSHQSTVRSL